MEIIYQILAQLHHNDDRMEYVELLNSLPKSQCAEALDVLDYMQSEKLISGNLQSNEIIRLTLKGKILLNTHQEDLEEQPTNKLNNDRNTPDANQSNKLGAPKPIKPILNAVLKIGAFAAAIVAVYELIEIFFG